MHTLEEYQELKKQELEEARIIVTDTRISLRHALKQEEIIQTQCDNAVENYKRLFPH